MKVYNDMDIHHDFSLDVHLIGNLLNKKTLL